MSDQQHKMGFPLFFIAAFWVSFIYGIAVVSLPYNPLSVPRILTMSIQTVCPQGWAFFTRNPREELTYFYRMNGDGLVLQNYQNAKAANGFGVSRKARLQSMELSMFASRITAEQWSVCDEGLKNCDQWKTLPRVVIENSFMHPRLCGEILLEKKELVPWAWSTEIGLDEVPSKIAKLFIVCPN